MGRVFTEAEDLQSDLDIAIIGYHVWVNRFSRDADILGKTIRLAADRTRQPCRPGRLQARDDRDAREGERIVNANTKEHRRKIGAAQG